MKTWEPIEVMLVGADVLLTFALLKAVVVAAVFGVLAGTFARRSPALRSALWSAAIGVLVLAPLLRTRGPAWGAGFLRFPEGLWQREAGSAGAILGLTGMPVALWLFALWLVVAVLLLVRQARDVGAAMRLRRTAREVTETRLLGCVTRVRAAVGACRHVALRISEDVAGPVSLGWRNPVVVLPPDALTWPAGRIEAVLCHEIAHIRRCDWPLLLAAEAVRALHWFNPFVAWMVARLRMAQDEACDAAALDAGFRPADYARHLVAVARSLQAAGPRAVLPMAGRHGLDRRVRALFEARRGEGVTRPAVVPVAALLALVAGLVLGGVNLWDCPLEDESAAGVEALHGAPL